MLSAYCHTLVKISQAFFGSLGQSVKNTNPVYTLSFYNTVIFSGSALLMLNIPIFLLYRFEAENVLVLFLNVLNVVSILACIGSPFIELLLYQPSSGLHMLLNLRSNHNII